MTATATERAMRPILMRPRLVRATLDGTKTQTRRVVKPQPWRMHAIVPAWGTSPDGFPFGTPYLWREVGADYPDGSEDERRCPYGQPGDRLWVRETWASIYDRTDTSPGVIYLADGPEYLPATRRGHNWTREIGRGHWKPSIHMPRWACRLVLEVTDVRIERLQEITEADIHAEGFDAPRCSACGYTFLDALREGDHYLCGEAYPPSAGAGFAEGWDSINARRGYGWDANPWVWVVSYVVHRTGPGAAE